jgi:WD40 repeat protein
LVHWVIFSPDGQLLVSGGAYTNVRFWDTRTWQPVRTLREADVNSVAFSPDAKVLATCGGDTIKFWDVQTGRLERVLPERPLFERLPAWVYRLVPALKPPPRGRVESVVFSPDGKTIAFGSGNDVKLMRIR